MIIYVLEQHADRCFIGLAGAYKNESDAENEAFLRGAKYNRMKVLCNDDYVFEITEIELS
jgi:hypothetical protein